MGEVSHLRLVSDMARHALNGETMGTRWSAVFLAPRAIDRAAIKAALQQAVDRVDAQMSPWKPESVLSLFNAQPEGSWIELPDETFAVLDEALMLNGLTEGSFDPFVGGAVTAWGFGCAGGTPDATAIAREKQQAERGGRSVRFDRDNRRMSRQGPAVLDLCGIAKGYGVDLLSEVLSGFGITRHLVSIDGEVRAEGLSVDGSGWSVAIEAPDTGERSAALTLEISDMAIATSGSYRHFHEHGGRRVSHTIDPATGAPVDNRLVSATVLADTALRADGLATALMVMGADRALGFCTRHGIAALLIETNRFGNRIEVPTPRFTGALTQDGGGKAP